jgi:hypothetical protein
LTNPTTNKKNRAARYGLVAAVAAALTVPLVSQHLRAQDDPTKPAAGGRPPAGAAAAADRPKALPLTATPAVDPSTVIASAGDVKVTAGDFEAFISGMPPQQQAQVGGSPEGKRQMAEQLLKLKALAAEAERRKLGDDPKVKKQLDAIRSQVLVQALVGTMQGDEAGDKQYFESHPEQFGRVQARTSSSARAPSRAAPSPS